MGAFARLAVVAAGVIAGAAVGGIIGGSLGTVGGRFEAENVWAISLMTGAAIGLAASVAALIRRAGAP
jgi:hypothetical protein